MPRLIDADALLNDIKDFPYGYRGMVKTVIENQQTISPPTTTWLGSYSPYQCEKCGYHVDSKTRYCPDCGRKAVNA